MAMTLAEAAKLTSDPLTRGVTEIFVQESAVLERMPFMDIAGNSYKYNKEATLPGVEFRAVNAAYSESTGTVNPATESITILGGDADVDTFIVKTQGSLNDQRAFQTRAKVKALSYKFQDAFINGDTAVDANSFDGLKKRLTGAQVISAATNGLPIVGASDDDRHAFFDKLDELLAAVPDAEALYMPRALRSKIRSAARRLTIYDQRVDDFGRVIQTYNGVDLRDLGTRPDGSDILPLTETQGSSSVTGSIYAVKFGATQSDQAVTGLQNGGIEVRDIGELETKPVYRTRIEWFPGMALFGGKAAARLKGVLAG